VVGALNRVTSDDTHACVWNFMHMVVCVSCNTLHQTASHSCTTLYHTVSHWSTSDRTHGRAWDYMNTSLCVSCNTLHLTVSHCTTQHGTGGRWIVRMHVRGIAWIHRYAPQATLCVLSYMFHLTPHHTYGSISQFVGQFFIQIFFLIFPSAWDPTVQRTTNRVTKLFFSKNTTLDFFPSCFYCSQRWVMRVVVVTKEWLLGEIRSKLVLLSTMRCIFWYLLLHNRQPRVEPQNTRCICRETCSFEKKSKRRGKKKDVTSQWVCIRFVSCWVVGGRILRGCYYIIENRGLRRKSPGDLPKYAFKKKNDKFECGTTLRVCVRFAW